MRLAGQERNLHVDSKTLKNALAPITQRRSTSRGLLQVAREQCLETLQVFQRGCATPAPRCSEFADYCDAQPGAPVRRWTSARCR